MDECQENLNENWFFKKTKEIPTRITSEWQNINLPHTWNNIDDQDGGNDYYRGVGRYFKEFSSVDLCDKCCFLEVNGAAMSSTVHVNGEKVKEHKGECSTYLYDVLKKLIFKLK